MDLVLLDTDVFSMFFRRDASCLRYEVDVRGKIGCLSFASVAELRFGAIVAGLGGNHAVSNSRSPLRNWWSFQATTRSRSSGHK